MDFPAKISLPGIDGKAIGITGINAHRDWNAFAVDEQPHPYDRKRPVFLVLAVLAKGSRLRILHLKEKIRDGGVELPRFLEDGGVKPPKLELVN